MKKEAFFAILIIVAVLLLFSFSRLFSSGSEEDARKFFAEDLKETYPTADLREISNVTKVGEGPDSYYSLKASVSSNLSTPCPERIEVQYYYPERNFVKRTQKIVYGCKVCINTDKCVITYPEEAVIASHTYEGTQKAKDFLASYPRAFPNATLLSSYEGQPNVWQVDWSDGASAYSLRVLISQPANRVLDVLSVQNGQ